MTSSESIPSSAWFGSWFRYSPVSLFAAGFISVLVFQQGTIAILNAVGFTPATPFSASRTWPLGVPQIWSFAFWGGVWGIVRLLREVVPGEVGSSPSSLEPFSLPWSFGSSSFPRKALPWPPAGIRSEWLPTSLLMEHGDWAWRCCCGIALNLIADPWCGARTGPEPRLAGVFRRLAMVRASE